MKFTPITDRQASEALSVAFDPDVCAVQQEEDMHRERAEVDQIIAEVDRELATEARTETRRIDRAWMDERRARRAARRAERAAVRALPSHPLIGGMPGQSNCGATWVDDVELDGEAA